MPITTEDLKSIDPNLGAPSPADTPEGAALQNAQDSPKTIAAKGILNNTGAPSNTTMPQQNDFQKANPALSDNSKDDSFSGRFKSSFGDLLGLKGVTGGGFMPLMALSGMKAMPGNGMGEEDTAPQGNVTFDQAQQNADATKPTVLPKQPDPRVLGAQNALQSFAAGAGAEGSPFNAISVNLGAQAQQRKDALINAKMMADTLHEQAVVHQLGEQQVADAVKTGQGGVDMMLNAHHPGELRSQGKTSDEIKQMIQQGKIDTKADTVWLTGRVQTGTDANGQPLFRSTYSVVRPGGPITFDGDTNEEERKFINDNLHLKDGDPRYLAGPKDGKPGMTLPAAQVNQMYKQAQVADANEAAAEESMSRNNLKREQAQMDPDSIKLQGSKELSKALTDTATVGDPSDPDHLAKAYYALKGNQAALAELGMSPRRFDAAFRGYASPDDPKHFDTMLENYQKSREKMEQKVNDAIGNDKETAAHPEFAANAAQLKIQQLATDKVAQQNILNSPTATQEQKNAAQQRMLQIQKEDATARRTQTLAQGTISDINIDKSNLSASEQKAKDTASMGDNSQLIESALNYDLDPEKQFGNRQDLRAKFMNQVETEAKKRGIPWRAADYQAHLDTVKDFAPKGKSNDQIRSLNIFTGHAGDANDAFQSLNNNTNVQFLNKPINKLATSVWGNDKYDAVHASLEAVKDEYLNFLKAGHAPTQEEIQRGEDIINPNKTPAQIQNTLRQMARTVAIRSRAINDSYRDVMGSDYAHMLSSESAKILRDFGIDPVKMRMGGITGETQPANVGGASNAAPNSTPNNAPQPNAATKAPAPQQPANTVHMKKPDGTYIYVPQAQVEAAKKLGAQQVQ
jgi:hypothetical protein